jgi:N-methylhydantoinase B
LVDARLDAAVAAGNVETSQRIVDVVLGAFAQAFVTDAPGRAAAASQGTMNNITIGGVDPRTGRRYAYYETVAGGMGATGERAGLSGVHVHMTNTLNTPAEALEYAYPLRVTRYELREGSGGAGLHRGGNGLIREIELLSDAVVTILSERRRHAPYGIAGGLEGALGSNHHSSSDGQGRAVPGKTTFEAKAGDRIRMETPGGGGSGSVTRAG